MKTSTITLLLTLPFLLAACASHRSEVATTFGYDKSTMVQAGPYQLHYGHSGSEELLLLAEGNWNVLSRATGQGTDVYLDGLPFIHFDRNHDGSVTNLSLDVLDTHGKAKISLIDRDADGQWDLKIDHDLKKMFMWRDGGWVERFRSQDGAANGSQPIRSETNRTSSAAGSRR
jgi:hypothetical protein